MAMFDLTNDEEVEALRPQIDYGNVESEKGTVGEILVNRHNQKHVLLLELLLYHQDNYISAIDENSDIEQEERQNIINRAKNIATKAYEFANGRYTSPHYGFSSKKDAIRTIKAAEKENHLSATMHSIMTDMPSNGTSSSTVKIAFLKEIKKNNDNKKRYDTTEAVKAVTEEIKNLYKNDNLVAKILNDIKAHDQEQIASDIKLIVGIMTSASVEETKRIGRQDFVLEKVSFVDNDSDFVGNKKTYTTKVKVGNICFNRNEIRSQTKNKTGDDISNAGLTYFLKNNKRYYLNKNTGYMFETPDKNIDSLDYNDNVRIFDGTKWYDDKDNAIASDSIQMLGIDVGNRIMFSYYDENKKSYIYCSPFTDGIKIVKTNNNGGKYPRRVLNTYLEGDIADLKNGKEVDFEKYKNDNFKGLGTFDILLRENVYDQLKAFEYIRRYGYDNPILPCRLKLKYVNIADIQRVYQNNVFKEALSINRNIDNDEYQLLNSWLQDNEILSIQNIKYENGLKKQMFFEPMNIQDTTIRELFVDELAVHVDSTVQTGNLFSNEMLGEDEDIDFINLIDGENNNCNNYYSDLALEACERKKKFEEAEKYGAEHPTDERKIQQLKAENKNKIKNAQIQAEIEEQNTLNIISDALNVLRSIGKEGMLVKFFKSIYKFFTGKKFISKDEEKYNTAVYAINSRSSCVALANDDANMINNIIAEASEKIGLKPMIINFNIKYNLKNAKRQKGKN